MMSEDKLYPCDVMDCPYEDYNCRLHCGLGVDTDHSDDCDCDISNDEIDNMIKVMKTNINNKGETTNDEVNY